MAFRRDAARDDADNELGNLAELREVIALAQQGRIKAHSQRFSLERTAEAYHLLHEGKIEGRAVVTPHG